MEAVCETDTLMQRHMTEMIESRRTTEEKVERHDLLSSLLDANDEEANSSAKLTAQELLCTFTRSRNLFAV